MGFIVGLLSVLATLLALLLMTVVLLQEPKGGGLASALGGQAVATFGPSVGRVNWFTSSVAGAWVLCCFLHSVLMPFTT